MPDPLPTLTIPTARRAQGDATSRAASAAWRRLACGVALLAAACGSGPADEGASRQAAQPEAALESHAGPEGAAPHGSTLGRFRPARASAAPASATPELAAELRRLESIGYAAGSRSSAGFGGVIRHDASRALAGLNLYVSGHAPVAILMDMEGRELHRWECAFERALPEFPPESALEQSQFRRYFRRCALGERGELYAIFEGHALVKLDARSRLQWVFAGGAHHDLELMPGGGVLVLTRTAHVLPRVSGEHPVLEDFVSELDAQGRELSRVSILECFERSTFAELLSRMPRFGDLLHTNTIELLREPLPPELTRAQPAFRPGRVLISSLKLSVLALLDLDERRVVWAASGPWRRQHQPTVLPDGGLLLFDNLGAGAAVRGGAGPPEGKSRVLELEPAALGVRWSYAGTPSDPLESETCSAAQRLSNGNTLITESDNGRALEVARDGSVVWEFSSPHRAGPDGALVATLFELVRLPDERPLEWISR